MHCTALVCGFGGILLQQWVQSSTSETIFWVCSCAVHCWGLCCSGREPTIGPALPLDGFHRKATLRQSRINLSTSPPTPPSTSPPSSPLQYSADTSPPHLVPLVRLILKSAILDERSAEGSGRIGLELSEQNLIFQII